MRIKKITIRVVDKMDKYDLRQLRHYLRTNKWIFIEEEIEESKGR